MDLARTVVVLALLIVGSATDARALDMPLAGKKLGMRDGVRARLVLLTRDRISAPAPGLADDPTVAGGRLEIGNPDTGEWGAFDLPAAGWAFDGTGTRFRFRDPAPRSDAAGIQRLVLRHRRRLRLRTQGIGVTLDESRQGTIAVVLTMGSRRYCTVFGGVVTYDEPGRFGALDAPAPAACPQMVTVSTTSTTTSSSTSSTGAQTTTSSVVEASTSTSSTSVPPTSTTSSLESSSSSSTSTSSSSSSTAEPTTTSSSTVDDTTTSSTSSSSSSSSSETSTSTSSTTTSTDFTCGGLPPLGCAGTCPEGQTCGGLFACGCN